MNRKYFDIAFGIAVLYSFPRVLEKIFGGQLKKWRILHLSQLKLDWPRFRFRWFNVDINCQTRYLKTDSIPDRLI